MNGLLRARNHWLKKFEAQKLFTAKEIEDALAEPLTAKRILPLHAIPQLSQKLKKSGDGNITTFIDMNKQLKLEKLVCGLYSGKSSEKYSKCSGGCDQQSDTPGGCISWISRFP